MFTAYRGTPDEQHLMEMEGKTLRGSPLATRARKNLSGRSVPSSPVAKGRGSFLDGIPVSPIIAASSSLSMGSLAEYQ